MSDRTDESDEVADLVAEAADDFRARQSRGEDPDPEEYAARHPAAADLLRRVLGRFRPRPAAAGGGGDPPGGERLGDYRIVREVGRGGMGVVYEAEQLSLGRRVALKVLPFAAVMDPRHLQRFKNEARAAAGLDHPHVVRVHAVGCERGVHYIAMQFVEGRTLADLIRERRGETPRPVTPDPGAAPPAPTGGNDVTRSFAPDATADVPTGTPVARPRGASSRTPADAAYVGRVAEWGVQAAEALEHAHALGIVHRDVKPGNLLVDGRGEVYVADFGLAKLASDPGVTGTGDVLGTVRYMSPEQAGAKHGLVDHRSDVYSLGVTLYELLTLTPAFAGTDRQQILSSVVSAEPAAPRSLDRRIPRDLETVILKAMDKDPSRRYQSAKEFGDDLGRFLEHRAVRARRRGVVDRAGKWTRRNRSVVWASGAVLVTGVAALAASTVLIARAYESEATHRKVAEDTAGMADEARREALEREAILRVELYATELRQAKEAWVSGEPGRLRELLDRHRPRNGERDHRGFEWYYLDACERSRGRVLAGHEFPLLSADISPDGRLIATSDRGGVVKLWDASTGAELRSSWYSEQEVTCVRFSPDGRTLATAGQDKTVRLWDVAGWSETACLRGHDLTVTGVSWSPDGKMLATGGRDHSVKIWNAASGRLIRSLVGHTDVVRCVAWSPDGKLLASAGPEPGIRLWTAATGKPAGTLTAQTNSSIVCLAFNPTGTMLASGGYHSPVVVHYVPSRQELHRIESNGLGGAWSVAFDPAGQHLLIGWDGSVEVWEGVNTHWIQRVRSLLGESRHRAVAYSRDGRTLLTAVEEERTARVIDATLFVGRSRFEYAGRWGDVVSSAGIGIRYDRSTSVTLRRFPGGEATGSLTGLSDNLYTAAFSAAGNLLATGTTDGRVQVWDAATARQVSEMRFPPSPVLCLTMSPDGSLVAGSDTAGTAHVWRTDTGDRVATMSVPDGGPTLTQFSPDGSILAIANKHDVVLWGVTSWSRQVVLRGNQGVNSMAFSPDSGTLATGGGTRGVTLWDVGTGRRLALLGEQLGPNRDPTFSPDGRTLATISADHTVRLWHVPTRRELFILSRHDSSPSWIRFESPHRFLVGVRSSNLEYTRVYIFPPRTDAPRTPDLPQAKNQDLPPRPKEAP